MSRNYLRNVVLTALAPQIMAARRDMYAKVMARMYLVIAAMLVFIMAYELAI